MEGYGNPSQREGLTSDGNTRIAKLLLDIEHVGDSVVRFQARWVGDEAILKLFDLSDHLCL